MIYSETVSSSSSYAAAAAAETELGGDPQGRQAPAMHEQAEITPAEDEGTTAIVDEAAAAATEFTGTDGDNHSLQQGLLAGSAGDNQPPSPWLPPLGQNSHRQQCSLAGSDNQQPSRQSSMERASGERAAGAGGAQLRSNAAFSSESRSSSRHRTSRSRTESLQSR